MPAGGYCQVLRQPFARWCAELRHDERGALLWLLVEANRRRRDPVLTMSKTAMAEAVGITWRRASRILARLVDVGAIAWRPGPGGLDGQVVVLAYSELVADGRAECGGDFAQLWTGAVDEDLERLGFDRWALLALAALEVGSATRTLAGPAGGLARHLGLTWRRLCSLAEGLVDAGELDWCPGAPGRTTSSARLVVLDYARLVASEAAEHDPGPVLVDHDGAALHRESARGSSRKRAGLIAKARGAPGLLPPSQEAQENTTPPTPPFGTPAPSPAGEDRGAMAPQLLDDREPLDDVEPFLDELRQAVAALGSGTPAHRLDHALAERTPAAGRLCLDASARLAAGWASAELAAATVGSRGLDDATHVDRVLASRLAALPLDPPPPNHPMPAPRGRPPASWPSAQTEPTAAASRARMRRYEDQRAGRACPACAGRGVVELPDATAARCACLDHRATA